MGIINKTSLDAQLVNERKCEVTCLLNDATVVKPRKVGFFSTIQNNYLGDLQSDEYEVVISEPYPTSAVLAGALNATDLTFNVTPATADVIKDDSFLLLDNEVMIVTDVVGTLVTVASRGYGQTGAVAHLANAEIKTMANVRASCKVGGECRNPVFKTSIKNAGQIFDTCTEWCEEDICKRLRGDCDAVGTEKVIKDVVDGQKVVANVSLLEGVAAISVRGVYGMSLDGVTKKYTTRGILQWVRGTLDGLNVTHSGLVYDVMASDPCVGIANPIVAERTGALTYDSLNRFYEVAGKLAPKWNYAAMNYNTFLVFNKVAEKACFADCGEPKQVKSEFISGTITTPFGDVQIVIDENFSDNQVLFYNSANIGWYSMCQIGGGNMFKERESNKDFEGRNKRWSKEGGMAIDASRNMCSDLALLEGFTKAASC